MATVTEEGWADELNRFIDYTWVWNGRKHFKAVIVGTSDIEGASKHLSRNLGQDVDVRGVYRMKVSVDFMTGRDSWNELGARNRASLVSRLVDAAEQKFPEANLYHEPYLVPYRGHLLLQFLAYEDK